MTEKTIFWMVQDQVLHILFPMIPGSSLSISHRRFLEVQQDPNDYYTNPELCREVLRVSSRYEGPNQFVGFNLPVTYIRPSEPMLMQMLRNYPSAKYMIAYMVGDDESRDHELRHAQFYIDTDYQHRVKQAWVRLQNEFPSAYEHVVSILQSKNYEPRVFMDEFQAYYPELIDKLT